MRIVFAGTPEFASIILRALLNHRGEFDIVGVLSQPARAKGRGLQVTPSPVEQTAREYALAFGSPERWTTEADDLISSWCPDILVTAAYGIILPRAAFSLPRFGAINVHASMLPRWRGAAPIQRSIEAGDASTGITIFQLADGVDTGDIYSQAETPIEPGETAAALADRLAHIGADLLPLTLREIFAGILQPRPQPVEGATRARKLKKSDGNLSWNDSAETIRKKWRAFQPWPGVTIGGCKLVDIALADESFAADSSNSNTAPGAVLSIEPLVVATSSGALILKRVQRSGGRAMAGDEFARGLRLRPGDLMDLDHAGPIASCA